MGEARHNAATEADRDLIRRYEGFFVGLLTEEEQESFNRCCEDGTAMRSYEGAGGFMGLPRVRVRA